MRQWKVWFDEDDRLMLECGFVPQCESCHTDMWLLNYKLIQFPLNEETGHALDVTVECPRCGEVDLFGVALSESQYNKAQESMWRK